MAIPDGFWTAGLEATKDRMNQNLIQFDTTANRPSAGTKGLLFVATDGSKDISYDNGSAWVEDIASVISQASQSEAEGEDNVDKYIPPDLIKNSPGVAKSWCSITGAGLLDSPDHGIATIGDTGTGNRDINYTTALSGSVYTIASSIQVNTDDTHEKFTTETTADVNLIISNDAGTVADIATGQVWFGDI